ncbi:hypothetical protein OF83DRAFT_1088283 [Amylostereum chailletii]|nr:hypothetical protein OF83DRAFT_1088283 [Amylostereum chailletii]
MSMSSSSGSTSSTTHTSSDDSGDLYFSRLSFLEDLRNAHEATLRSMCTTILPEVPSSVLDHVCTRLVDIGAVTDKRWTPTSNPEGGMENVPATKEEDADAPTEGDGAEGKNDAGETEKGSSELVAFQFMAEIFRDTMDCLPDDRKPSTQLDVSGTKTPFYRRTNASRPDGYASALSAPRGSVASSGLDDWMRIVWVQEFTLEDDEESRLDDWRQVVHLFIALGTATHAELGYDETVRLVEQPASGSPVYELDVYSPDVDPEHPRAPRTFRTVKDVWIDSDRRPEHTTLRHIRGHLGQDPRTQHFLTVVVAGLVPVSPSRSEEPGKAYVGDDTKTTIRRGRDLVSRRRTRLHIEDIIDPDPPPSSGNGTSEADRGINRGWPPSVGGIPTIPFQDLVYIDAFPHCHYRVVFEEVGVAVADLRRADHMFIALKGAAMHEAGVLHRDPSAGNILVVRRDNGEYVGVIMDLEHAAFVADPHSPHDARTGTWPFIPTEVLANAYTDMPFDARPRVPPLKRLGPDRKPPARRPFRPNAFHDAEAVWWIAVWFSFAFVPAAHAPAQAHRHAYRALFPDPGRYSPSTTRTGAWRDIGAMAALLSRLPSPSLAAILTEALYHLLSGKTNADADAQANSAQHAIGDVCAMAMGAVAETTDRLLEAICECLTTVDDRELVPGLPQAAAGRSGCVD